MRVLKRLLETMRGTDGMTHAELTTMFGRTLVYDTTDEQGDALRVLDVEGSWQSGSYLGSRWNELAFAYHRRIDDAVFGSGLTVSRMLMLGGGALSYPKYVLTHHADIRVDVVEVDAAITELARRYFFYDRLSGAEMTRLNVIHGDAASILTSLATSGSPSYDVIVNDAFAAFEAPWKLSDPSAISAAHALLSPDGLYVANVVAALRGAESDALFDAVSALGGSFSHVFVIPLGSDEPMVPDNNVVIATDGPHAFADALAATDLR